MDRKPGILFIRCVAPAPVLGKAPHVGSLDQDIDHEDRQLIQQHPGRYQDKGDHETYELQDLRANGEKLVDPD